MLENNGRDDNEVGVAKYGDKAQVDAPFGDGPSRRSALWPVAVAGRSERATAQSVSLSYEQPIRS